MALRLHMVRRDQGGITVPYPPICDEIRDNRGFTDIRGRPEAAAVVAEGDQSPALRDLLIACAQSDAPFFTLACDIGAHRKKAWFTLRREVTGGYVQVLSSRYADQTEEHYHELAMQIGVALRGAAGGDVWEIELTPVQFNLDDFGQLVLSLSIWFFAEHRTTAGARDSRERLIRALHRAISSPAAAAIFHAGKGT